MFSPQSLLPSLLTVFITIFFLGCASPIRNTIPRTEISSVKPLSVVLEISHEPDISYYDGMDAVARQMASTQGGALGGALAHIAISAKEERLREQRIGELGTLWDKLLEVDYSKVIYDSFHLYNTDENWFSDISIVDDTSAVGNNKLNSNNSIFIESSTLFASDLSYFKVILNYDLQWESLDGSTKNSHLEGVASKVFFSPSGSVHPEQNANAWKAEITNAEDFITNSYTDLLDVLIWDISAPRVIYQFPEREYIKLWGLYGWVEDIVNNQIMFRSFDDEITALPFPEILHREVKTVAIESTETKDDKNLAEMLHAIITEQGYQATIVNTRSEGSGADIYLSISSDWGRDFITYLRTVSFSVFDPESGSLLSYGVAARDMMKMFPESADELLRICWDDALEKDLRVGIDVLNAKLKSANYQEILVSPLGE